MRSNNLNYLYINKLNLFFKNYIYILFQHKKYFHGFTYRENLDERNVDFLS